MSTDPDQHALPLRTFPAHWTAAIVALSGALALQFAWPTVFSRQPAESWWPYDACVLATATGFLLASAWLHAGAARWRTNELVPRMWQLGEALQSDLVVGLFAFLSFLAGPEAHLLRAGLWIVSPVLLASSAASAIVIGLALHDSVRRFTTDVPPPDAPYGRPRHGNVRLVCAAALVVSLIATGAVEPQVKPWERRMGKAGEGQAEINVLEGRCMCTPYSVLSTEY